MTQDTPSPVQKTGRSRGRGTWRAPQKMQQIQTGRIGKDRGQAGTDCMRRMATKPRHNKRHSKIDARTTLVRRAQRRAHRTSENTSVFGRERKSDLPPASSGWTYDSTPRCVLHSSPSRCWWREGELGPSEYGNAGAYSQTGPISCGAVARGSRLYDTTIHKTTCLQYDAPHSNWHVGPTGFPPTMGRGDASSGRSIDTTQNIMLIRTIIYVDIFMTIRYLAQVAPFHLYCMIIHFVIFHISVLVSLHYYVISLHSCSHPVYLCIYI